MENSNCSGTWVERTWAITSKSEDTVLVCNGCGEWWFIHPDGTSDHLPTTTIVSQP